MTDLYGILLSADNVYDIAGFEDISVLTAERVIDMMVAKAAEPMYIVYGALNRNGFEIAVYRTKAQLDAEYTYNKDLIDRTITRLNRK